MKRRRKTRVDKIAEGLRVLKKRFSVGGSGFSRYRGKHDYDLRIDYRLRLKLPPVRVPVDITVEDFKRLLKEGRLTRPTRVDEEELTTEDFRQLLQQEEFISRRRRREIKKRRIASLEYFEQIEERWWIQQQMQILLFLDEVERKQYKRWYRKWFKTYAPKVAKAVQALKDSGKVQEAKELQKFFEELIERNKPKKENDFARKIRNTLRVLVLKEDWKKLSEMYKDLQLIAEIMKHCK